MRKQEVGFVVKMQGRKNQTLLLIQIEDRRKTVNNDL